MTRFSVFFLVSLPCPFLPCLGGVSILSRLVSRYFAGRLDLVSILSRVVSVSFCDLPYDFFIIFKNFWFSCISPDFSRTKLIFVCYNSSNFVNFLLFWCMQRQHAVVSTCSADFALHLQFWCPLTNIDSPISKIVNRDSESQTVDQQSDLQTQNSRINVEYPKSKLGDAKNQQDWKSKMICPDSSVEMWRAYTKNKSPNWDLNLKNPFTKMGCEW